MSVSWKMIGQLSVIAWFVLGANVGLAQSEPKTNWSCFLDQQAEDQQIEACARVLAHGPYEDNNFPLHRKACLSSLTPAQERLEACKIATNQYGLGIKGLVERGLIALKSGKIDMAIEKYRAASLGTQYCRAVRVEGIRAILEAVYNFRKAIEADPAGKSADLTIRRHCKGPTT
jgi:hypothetical protein